MSRQTLYNEFGSRDEFGQALVIREGSRFLDAGRGGDRRASRRSTRRAERGARAIPDDRPGRPARAAPAGGRRNGRDAPAPDHAEPPCPRVGERAAGRDDRRLAGPAFRRRISRRSTDVLVRLAISHVTAPRDPPAGRRRRSPACWRPRSSGCSRRAGTVEGRPTRTGLPACRRRYPVVARVGSSNRWMRHEGGSQD